MLLCQVVLAKSSTSTEGNRVMHAIMPWEQVYSDLTDPSARHCIHDL
jgi:hypothetical protein